MRRLLLVAFATMALAACGGPAGSGLTLAGGGAARTWGDGPYGLVLVPDAGRDAASWDAAARTFAENGMTVLAVDEAAPGVIVAALRHLLDERGLERAALLGAGDGAAAAMAAAIEAPELVDQLVVLSATGDVTALAEFPKLFVASSGEAAAADAERMAAEAAGTWNALYLAEGAASGQALLEGPGSEATMVAVLRRLEERR